MASELFGRNLNYEDEGWIDRRGSKRTVPMEVLVLGMPRTGTSSMVTALGMLGYGDIYHMSSCVRNPPDCELWDVAIEAKWYGKGKPFGIKEWDQLLGHCQAVTDFPAAAFAKELVETYPDAKVVLNTRSVDAWYDSFQPTILAAMQHKPFKVLAYLDPAFMGRWVPMCERLLGGFFGTGRRFAIPGEAGVKERYLAHYDEVRALVPAERLLEYHVGDGWEPLCKFLGKDVPAEDFPRINETASFGATVQMMLRRSLQRFLKDSAKVLTPLLVLAGSIYIARRRAWL